MAGWLAQKQPARLWMTRLEYLTLRVLTSYTGQEAPEEAIQFYKAAGWDEEALDHYRARFGDFGKAVYPLPDNCQALKDARDEVCAQVVIGSIASGPQPRRQAIDEALRPRIELVARWDER